MNEVIIRLVDVPVDLKGVVKEDSNGDYNIYINARLSSEQQVETCLHEMAHIKFGHLHSARTLEEIEDEAEKRTTAMLLGEAHRG